MLDVLVSIKDEEGNPRFSADEVTGMFISLMFAGHHTSSGTSSWTLIELIRHPDVYAEVVAELDELYADGQEVSFHALRQIPKLDNVVKETLRLHPPLIILMRVAKGEFEVEGFPIHEGDFVAASPAISNRIPEDFPDPDAFNPDRYNKPEQADVANRWTWIPFGAGRHRCVGAAFAHDADQGDLLGSVARVRVRDGTARRQLPQRPLQDGRAAGPAGQGALPQAQPRRSRQVHGLPRRSRPGPVPGPRHVRTGGARLLHGAQARQGRDPRRRTTRRRPRRRRAGRRDVSYPSTIHQEKRKTDNGVIRRARISTTGSSGGCRPTRTPRRPATGSRWPTSTPTTPPTAGTSGRRKT